MTTLPISRRHFLPLLAGLGAAGCESLTPSRRAPADAACPAIWDEPFTAARLQIDLEAYDRFGVHRSGSAADLATAEWLAADWKTIGYDVSYQSFDVPDHDGLTSELQTDGGTLTLLAQPPYFESGDGMVSGRLVHSDRVGAHDTLRDAILVADAPFARGSSYNAPEYKALAERALAVGARALIIITHGPTSQAFLLNIDPDRTYPITAMAAPSQADQLRRMMKGEGSARLMTPVSGPRRKAHNVIARLDRGPKTLVVSTPMSGWTHCAGERGPGVAAIRALSQWLFTAAPDHSILLTANSGHELASLGSRLFLEHEAPPPEEVALWLHLGAGIAARDWHETSVGLLPLNSADPQRFLLASTSIKTDVSGHVAHLPGFESVYDLTPQSAAGELKEIAEAGYSRVVGAFGAHRYHHVMSDRMATTSGELAAPMATAFRETIASLLKLPTLAMSCVDGSVHASDR